MTRAPIIDLQRRLTLVGAIRTGEKGPKGEPRKLGTFRLTSPRKSLIEQAAKLYGGEVAPWRSPVGEEFEVVTEAAELPVLVMPGYSLRQTYEHWEGPAKRARLCDGIDEELSAGPCICNATGDDVCDLYTRLVVALPELDTVLGWRLITRGANAAHELPTMMQLLDTVAHGQAFVPARLRVDERRGQKDGQTLRFVVPTIDLAVSYLALTGAEKGSNGPKELSYETTPRREIAVEAALAAVAPEKPPTPTKSGRSTAPLGPAHEVVEGSRPPLPVGEQLPVREDAPLMISEAQRRKMMALFREKEITDRDLRLAYAQGVIGRKVQSANDLTFVEASAIIDHVQQYDADNPQSWPLPKDL